MVNKGRKERRVSTRVRGFELALLERSGLSNGEIVRYGIRKYFEENPMINEHAILTEISFLQDKNNEYSMKIEANELLIQKKLEELKDIRMEYGSVIYDRLIGGMYNLLLEFMDDERYSWEVRSDLSNFYSIRRDSISLLASRFHKTFDESVELFEKYLDSFDSEDALLLNLNDEKIRS